MVKVKIYENKKTKQRMVFLPKVKMDFPEVRLAKFLELKNKNFKRR